MGGDVTDEMPEKVAVSHMEETEFEELAPEEEVEEQETAVEPMEPVPMKQEPVAAQGDDWMADYEGQLNIDMYQTKDNVIIKSTIAGVRPEDIDITVANDMVTVKGAPQKRRECG